MKQSLYILAFKNEPLIKIGLSRDTYMRSSTLGLARFDLKNSCLVHAREGPGQGGCIAVVECRVILLTEHVKLLAYLWVGSTFLLGEGRQRNADCQPY